MNGLVQDLRYALRQLRKSPAFAAVAVLTIALGVGLNSAIFRLIDTVLLRELPVEQPRLLVLPTVVANDNSGDNFSYSEFEHFRDHSQSFSGSFAFDTTRLLASVDGKTEYLLGQCVSTNFYSVLGVRPILGRTFLPQDNQGGQPAVAVISYDYWQREFGADPGVLSKSVSLKTIPFRIIGVAPASFQGIERGDAVDIWIPMLYWPQVRLADHLTVGIMARLTPETTLAQASSELNVLDRQYMEHARQENQSGTGSPGSSHRSVLLRSGARGLSDLPDELPGEMNILLGVAGFVLLIACANIANLQLVRSISRSREIATRLALGASRLRLMRHFVIEGLLLAIAGGVVGFLLANLATHLLLRLVIPGSDLSLKLDVDARVLWFSAAVAIFSGLLCGLTPTLGVKAASGVHSGGKAETGDTTQRKLSQSLLVVQIGLSVALLVGTGLMVRSLKKLSSVDPGFQRDHILLAYLYPTLGRYQGAKELNLYSTLLQQMQTAPGVLSASLSRFPLLSGGGWQRKVVLSRIEGAEDGASVLVHCNPVSPRFFATMGIPLILGRDFNSNDAATAPKVAIISEAFARKAFPRENAIGKQIRFVEDTASGAAEVIGVVRDIHSFSLRTADPKASVYIALAQAPPDLLGQTVLEVRTTEQPALASAGVRRVMQSIDAQFPLARMSSQVEQTSESLTTERSLSMLLSLFSLLATVLASIGLYGVVAYSTSRRTREIGVRVALGARRPDIIAMVLGQGMRLTLIGLGIGFPIALAGTRLLASQLFGVTATDPLTLAGVIVALTTVSLLACYWPARRAAKVDPMAALRYE